MIGLIIFVCILCYFLDQTGIIDRIPEKNRYKLIQANTPGEYIPESKEDFNREKARQEYKYNLNLWYELKAEKESLLSELEKITEQYELTSGILEPLTASNNDSFSGDSGAMLYMDLYEQANNSTVKGKRKKAPETDRLKARREQLQSKIRQLDGKIFKAEQAILKARYILNN